MQPKVTDRRPTPWWRRWVAPAALVLGGIVIAENAMAIDATAPRWVDGVSSFAMAMLFLGLGLAVVAGERWGRAAILVSVVLLIAAYLGYGPRPGASAWAALGIVVLGSAGVWLAIGLARDWRRRGEVYVPPGMTPDPDARASIGVPPGPAGGRWWSPLLGGLVIAGLVVALSLVPIGITLAGWHQARQREAEAALVVRGRVISRHEDDLLIRVRYVVPDADGRPRVHFAWTTVYEPADYELRSRVDVHVDPHHPTHLWVEGYDPVEPLGFSIALAVVAVAAVARPVRSQRAQARLLANPSAPAWVVQIQAFEGSLRRVGIWRSPDGPPSGWWSVRPRNSSRHPFVGQEVLLIGSPRVGGTVAVLSPHGPIWLRGRLASDRRLHGRHPIAPLAVPAWINGGQPFAPPPAGSSHPPGWVPPPTPPPWVPPAAGLPTLPAPVVGSPPGPSGSPVPLPPPPPPAPTAPSPAPEAVTTASPPADESAEPHEPTDEHARSPERWTPPVPWRPTDRWQPDHPGAETDEKTSPGAF